MMDRDYIVIAVCLAGTVFLVWKEMIRANRLRLVWRILASVIALGCLGSMVIPIDIKVSRTSGSSVKQAVWLTEGYSPDSLKKFLAEKGNEIFIYTADGNIMKTAARYHPVFLASPGMFADSIENFKSLHVFGYGFSNDEIKDIENLPFVFHPSSSPSGISSVNWSRHIKSGEPLLIQGNFHNGTGTSVKLILNGLETNLDSVLITAGRQMQFELSTLPKHSGRALYSLIALSGKDTLELETIPVEIEIPQSLRILFLASSPDFENKFLKSWLFKNGFPITTRTTISRNKYQEDFLNGKEMKLDRITDQLLENFDVVISDAAALAVMTAQELSVIRSRVEQEGLGLVIKADSFGVPAAFYARPFPLLHGMNGAKNLGLHWHSLGIRPQLLINDNPAVIKKMPGTQPLTSEKSSVYISSSLLGSGRLVVTTLDNTYSWALAGNDTAYHSLWSMIIQQSAPVMDLPQNWQVEPAFPKPDKPVQLTLQMEGPEIPEAMLGKSKIYFKQNIDFPVEWKASYWPTQTGWLSIEHKALSSWLYIFRDREWLCMDAFEKLEATKNYVIRNRQLLQSAGTDIDRTTRMPVSKIYFFIGILISCAYLWLEKKYSNVY